MCIPPLVYPGWGDAPRFLMLLGLAYKGAGMPLPGEVVTTAFAAGFVIAEAAMATCLLALFPIVMLKKLLSAAGWGS